MRQIRLTLFLLLVQFAAFAQNSAQSDEQQVQQLIQGSFDSIFSEYDAEKLSDFYSADFILLEHGEIWDMDFIKNYLKKARQNPSPPTRTNRFEFIRTVIEGNRAWVAYHNYATISRDGQVLRELYWLESATAIKTAQGWRLDMLHSTRAEKE
jgi:ketosteroid isomerase-like protein